MGKALKKSFSNICRDFFPRWKDGEHWRIRRTRMKASWQGYCEREQKLILIRHIPFNKKSLDSLIIHEICHAVTNDYHGERFQQRILKASQKAHEMDDRVLCNMIANEIDRIKKGKTKGA